MGGSGSCPDGRRAKPGDPVLSPRRVPRAVVAWLIGLTFAGGCSGVSLRPGEGPHLLDAWRATATGPEGLSPRTALVLRRWDLETVTRKSPLDGLQKLQIVVRTTPEPDLVFALAELSYQLAQKAELDRQDADHHACAYYYLCAGYSYHYLFDFKHQPDQSQGGEDSTFDPRFRLACDLYNTSLAKCVEAAEKLGKLDPRKPLAVPTPDGKGFALSVTTHNFRWKPEEFTDLRLAAAYNVVGIDNKYRTYGLGVPLIGVRDSTALGETKDRPHGTMLVSLKADDPPPNPGWPPYPKVVGFPVTGFFRFDGPLDDLCAHRSGVLELHNPLARQAIKVCGRSVPLETDLTTPLAFSMAHTGFQEEIITGFLDAAKVEDRAGIYFFEPYQPGKIPVLMVHGLISSPLTWAQMYNDLNADPAIRSRYQFWFYLYPTGAPWLTSAAELRQDIEHLKRHLDPASQDPALDHLVCVGHSMGGLVSKMLTVRSGDDFWKLASAVPVADLKADPKTRRKLEEVFYFEPERGVERVVFIGTPHRGSKLSPGPLGALADRLVHFPQKAVQNMQELMKDNPAEFTFKLPTSVDLLSPNAPALMILAGRHPPAGVRYNSIIGQAPADSSLRTLDRVLGDNHEKTDGAVPYWSAHISDAESELVVPADHLNVHKHPLSVREVRRILLEHWQAAAGAEAGGRK